MYLALERQHYEKSVGICIASGVDRLHKAFPKYRANFVYQPGPEHRFGRTTGTFPCSEIDDISSIERLP
jgi:hypothetical protein